MTLAAIIAVSAAYAASVFAIIWYLGSRMDRRLDRIDDRLSNVETIVTRTDQRLADHVTPHAHA